MVLLLANVLFALVSPVLLLACLWIALVSLHSMILPMLSPLPVGCYTSTLGPLLAMLVWVDAVHASFSL